MRIPLVYIALFLSTYLTYSQVNIVDNGFQQCFIDHYPELLSTNSQLDTAASANLYDSLACTSYTHSNLDILNYFPNISTLELHNVNTNDLSALFSCKAHLKNLVINGGSLSTVPSFENFDSLYFIKIINTSLTTFPKPSPLTFMLSLNNNKITNISFDRKCPNITTVMANVNSISSVSNLDSIPNLKVLFLGQNQLKSLPSFHNHKYLERLHFYNNDVTELKGVNTQLGLHNVNYASNELSQIPDFGEKLPANTVLNYNRYTFEDLLPIKNDSAYHANQTNYLQKGIGTTDTIYIDEPQSWTWDLDFDQSISSNYYLWYKDDELIDSSRVGRFSIDLILPEHVGTYKCLIKNTELTQVTLSTASRVLEVNPFIGNTEPVAFSPNGDGIHDMLYVEKSGTSQVINEQGEVVKEFETPGTWDGTTSDNSPAEFGYYIILTNGKHNFSATLVR